jgi:hypothetical protein
MRPQTESAISATSDRLSRPIEGCSCVRGTVELQSVRRNVDASMLPCFATQ